MQNILTALFDASNQIPGVRWRAEAAAKTLADAQRNFDAFKPGRHPEAAVSSGTLRLENAKKAYESITSEHTMLLQKHGSAIIRMAQALQPPASVDTRPDMEDLEQRTVMSMHKQLQSHKQAIRDELEERDRKLTRSFNTRITDLQTKLENDMRKFLDDRIDQDIGVSLKPVKAQLSALKIEMNTMHERKAETKSVPQPEVPREPVATLSALNLLRTKVESLESVQNDITTLKADSLAIKDSHSLITRSVDDVKSTLMSHGDDFWRHAARADSLEDEIVALQGHVSKLQEKSIDVPEPAAEVNLEPILSDLSAIKAHLASLGSQVDVLKSKETVDLDKELNTRGYHALLAQSQRHDAQLRQHEAVSRAIQQQSSPADAELASNVQGAISDLAQFKLSVEKRLQALLGKLSTLSEECRHLQDRYESTSTQALHNAIVATMVRQYPVQEWKSAFGDLNAKLQNLAQNAARNFGTLQAQQSIAESNHSAVAAYQEKQKTLSARIDAAESAIAAARNDADRRLSVLEPRLLHDLNFEQRVLPLENSTSELVETTARLGSLIDTKYDSMKASVDLQLAKLVSQCAQTSQGLSEVDVNLKDIVKDVRELEQSTNNTSESAILERLLEKATEQLDLRCNDLTTSLDKKADTALQRLEDTDSRLAKLQDTVGQDDSSPSANITLEPQTVLGRIKWIKDRCVSLENALHRSLADARDQPKDWLECHDQVQEGLRLRDDILDSHVRVLALGNKSLAKRVTVTDDNQPRTVFRRSRQSLSAPANPWRLKKSSFELESADTTSSTPIKASPASSSMQPPPPTGSAQAKRKRAGTNDAHRGSGPSSMSASETTPTRRGPGRPKKIKLPQSTDSDASGTAGRRLDSPEAPVSPPEYIDLID